MIQVHKSQVWFLLAGAIVLLMGVKVGRPFLLTTNPSIELNNHPALLFFNNDEGCECIIPVYQKADAVIAAWTPEQRAQVPLHRVVLDERPDLQRRYDIERAPMLLLLDAQGKIVWQEWGVASNPNVFDLARVEAKISLVAAAAESD